MTTEKQYKINVDLPTKQLMDKIAKERKANSKPWSTKDILSPVIKKLHKKECK